MNATATTPGAPTAVDRHVGARIKMRRMMQGWSQEKLAAAIGITFQQVQKYEKGVNRVSAGRLFQIAKLLDAAVFWFFEGAPGTGPAKVRDGNNELVAAFFGTNGAATLAAYYLRLPHKSRAALLDVAAAMTSKAATDAAA